MDVHRQEHELEWLFVPQEFPQLYEVDELGVSVQVRVEILELEHRSPSSSVAKVGVVVCENLEFLIITLHFLGFNQPLDDFLFIFRKVVLNYN